MDALATTQCGKRKKTEKLCKIKKTWWILHDCVSKCWGKIKHRKISKSNDMQLPMKGGYTQISKPDDWAMGTSWFHARTSGSSVHSCVHKWGTPKHPCFVCVCHTFPMWFGTDPRVMVRAARWDDHANSPNGFRIKSIPQVSIQPAQSAAQSRLLATSAFNRRFLGMSCDYSVWRRGKSFGGLSHV